MTKLITFLFFLSFLSCASAQQPATWKELDSLANTYMEAANYDTALVFAYKALAQARGEFGVRDTSYAESLSIIGSIYYEKGVYDSAELYLNQCLLLHKEILGEKHPDYAKSLGNLATVYKCQGKYVEAESLYLKSIKIYKELFGKKHSYYTISLNNLGLLYERQGKYKEAEHFYLRGIILRKEISGEKHPSYATLLNNLAILYQKQGKYIESESLYLKSINIVKESLGEKHINYVNSLNNLTFLYILENEYMKGELFCLTTIKICQEILGEKHPYYATSLSNLATLYKYQSKYKQADSLYVAAKQIHKNALGVKNIDYIKTLFNLAKLGAITHQCLSADSIFTEALSLQQEILLENFAAMSERDRTDFLATMKENYEYYHYFSQHCGKENPAIYGNVYNVLLQQKGILLYSTQKMRQLITESQDSVVNHLYIKWLDEKSYGNKMAQLPKQKRESMGINLLEIQHTADSLEKAICYKLPVFKEAITVPRGDWKEVQKQLKRHEAAIEIVRFRTFNNIKATDTVYYGAYILTAETQQQPIHVCMQHGKEMEGAWLEDYQKRIKNANLDTSAYIHYFQAIAQQLPAHIQKIYFAADGVYHELNVSAFLLPSAQKTFLISKYEMVNVGTTADILKYPTHSLKKEAFLVGNPNTNAPVSALSLSTDIAERGNLLVDLPAAEKEAMYLDSLTKRYFWQNVLVTGMAAQEDVIKKMQAPRIVLFAAHGTVNPIDTTLDAYYNDYMRRSWLALTGYTTIKESKDSSLIFVEDGKLMPEEIGDMNLYGTELVILSACESGKGKTSNGEGVYGLQRGFKIAGVENIIMTLDAINDYYTLQFMKRFYYHFITLGKSVHKAFVATQLQCIEKRDIPEKTWMKFILVESKVKEY